MYKKRYDIDYFDNDQNDKSEDVEVVFSKFSNDKIKEKAERFGFVSETADTLSAELEEIDIEEDIEVEEDEPIKKRSVGKRILITIISIIIVLAILVGAVVFIAYGVINKLNIVGETHKYEVVDTIEDETGTGEDSDPESINSLEARIRANIDDSTWETMSSKDVVNVLLIGTDARSNERGRSDTIMIASLNTKSRQILLTSILRDVYVEIPGKGYNRINAAYAYGGPPLLLDTIEANFKIKIEKYAYTNFYDYIDIVDEMGGITIMMDDDEVDSVNSMSKAYAEQNNLKCPAIPSGSGQKQLNGIQTLMYSRIRKADSDFARTSRQRLVLQQLFYEMKSKNLTEMYDLMDILLPKITTNMTDDEIFYLLLNSPTYFKYSITEQQVPVSDSYENMTIRGMAVLGIDFDANIKQLRNTIFDKTTIE